MPAYARMHMTCRHTIRQACASSRAYAGGKDIDNAGQRYAKAAGRRNPGMKNYMNKLSILGIRGIPADHGGFETFAENLALYLVARGWEVTVYCQEQGDAPIYVDHWQGVRLVHVPVSGSGTFSTIVFDWKSTLHACSEKNLVLTLGYNTAIFCAMYRLTGVTNLINMDGIEWQRQKWGPLARAWFYVNERAGVWLGNHLVADHPEIKAHLATRVRASKISTILYGAPRVEEADASVLGSYGLEPGGYAILIARAEPENSILEVVRAWSRKRRGVKLVVLGKYADDHAYQSTVRAAGSDEVMFVGATYDARVVQALRFDACFYIHGHQVGGTNPSLVEAMGAGSGVLAHDNRFNRWVAGSGAQYFADEEQCAQTLDTLLTDTLRQQEMRDASVVRYNEAFTWEQVLSDYERLLLQWQPQRHPALAPAEANGARTSEL